VTAFATGALVESTTSDYGGACREALKLRARSRNWARLQARAAGNIDAQADELVRNARS
jgi:hypothetical protein